MASTSALHRSSGASTVNLNEGENCPFRRSQSRVFFDSEITAGTSWQFRGIQFDSPIPPQSPNYRMQLSVLRSPATSGCGGLVVASPVQIATESSILHRSIPSPPQVKDDLSDGSRNSTGSSTGSHRSQDSGFSDSGETRPARKISASNITLNGNSHLSVKSRSSIASNATTGNCNEVCCSQIQYNDSNKHYRSQSRTSMTFDCATPQDILRNKYPHHYHQNTPIYSRSATCNERWEGTGVPSPIPHSGSGCGKLVVMKPKNMTCNKLGHFPQQNHPGEYGEINGNSVPECSNCIYQEITGISPQTSATATYHSPQTHFHHNGNGLSGTADVYGMYSSVVEPNGHFIGAPVCSSTPKRSNTPSTSSSRLSIVQKIDNFESLNKNMKTLDKNNNSNNSNNNNSGKSSSSSGNRSGGHSLTCLSPNCNASADNFSNSKTIVVRTQTEASPLAYQGLSVSPLVQTNAEVPSSSSGKINGFHLSDVSKRHSSSSIRNSSKSSIRNSASSIASSTYGHHQNQNSSSVSLQYSTNGNFPYITESRSSLQHRAPLPLPSVAESSVSHSSRSRLDRSSTESTEQNNNTLVNEFSTYASHSKSKSCTKVSPTWQSLPKGYRRVSLNASGSPSASFSEKNSPFGGTTIPEEHSSTEQLVVVKSHFDNDAMRMWLHELRSQAEPECSVMLQSKAICPDVRSSSRTQNEGPNNTLSSKTGGVSSDVESVAGSTTSGSGKSGHGGSTSGRNVVQAIHAIQSPLMSIKNVEQMANVVSAEFAKICKNIEFGFLSQVPSLVLSLVEDVEEFLRKFQSTSSFGNLQKLENKLAKSCRRLYRSANQMIDILETENGGCKEPTNIYSIIEPEGATNSNGNYHVAVSEVVDGIVTVGNFFSQVVDLRLTRDLSCILDIVEGGGVPAKMALKSFATILIEGGNHLCRLASEIRTVRGLLGVILDTGDNYLRIMSLRCLATVLCVGEAVKDFDRASGFEIVSDFMYEPTYPLELKIEAVSVLTQATDPWIDLETSLSTLGNHLEKIVFALTNLIPQCQSSEESFLLVVAAISNLTFLEVSSIGILRRCATVSLIIEAIEKPDAKFSVFVLDHVATILANMAGVESCREDIVNSGGVHALLKFLEKRPTLSNESAAEIMACERVQQKSTIAISRLCTEAGVAKLILERGGLHRLVMLSRNEKERNYSDGVLIAALATLRKLVSICGDEAIRGLEADDLIQPRLLDSFLLYSSRQESYV